MLGPNGAGKSTVLNCICGLLEPSSGRIRVLGHDVVSDGRAARASLGVTPQELALYEDLSARENLEYWGGAQGLRGAELRERVREALELASLGDRAREPVKRFSGGMKRRPNFACGVLLRPKVVLLDEPTVGVDPQSRVRLLDLVREQARDGACVLYTTHYMDEAEQLCHRLAVIDHGEIVAAGTVEELRARSGEHDLLRLSGSFRAGDAQRAVGLLEDSEVVQATADQLTIALRNGSQRLPLVLAAVQQEGAQVRDVKLSQPNLETLFIKLTGRELRE